MKSHWRVLTSACISIHPSFSRGLLLSATHVLTSMFFSLSFCSDLVYFFTFRSFSFFLSLIFPLSILPAVSVVPRIARSTRQTTSSEHVSLSFLVRSDSRYVGQFGMTCLHRFHVASSSCALDLFASLPSRLSSLSLSIPAPPTSAPRPSTASPPLPVSRLSHKDLSARRYLNIPPEPVVPHVLSHLVSQSRHSFVATVSMSLTILSRL